MKLASSTARMGPRLNSLQPAKITVEESENLVAWTPREDMQASASSDRSLYSITDSLLDPRLFYKATAKAIR